MNAQEVFDRAVSGVIDQRRPSVDLHGCCYRGPEGLRCAVGWLIPDELYDQRMEGHNAASLIEGWPALKKILGEHLELLSELQFAHDAAASCHDFVKNFKRLARHVGWDHGLDLKITQ